MTLSTRTASATLVLVLAACGAPQVKEVPTVGVASGQDAARLALSTGEKLQGLPADSRLTAAVSGDGGVLNTTLTYACATRGSATMTIAASQSAGGVTSITEDLTADGCVKANAYQLDGHVTYTYTVDVSLQASGKSMSAIAIDGTLATVLHKADGTVDQSATVSYQHVTWQLTSQASTGPSGACVLVTVTASGSMSIGGVTFTVNGDDLAGAWGASRTGPMGVCP